MNIEVKPGPSTIATIEVDARRLEYLAERMAEISNFFEARDEMNAQVHLSGVRFSPITTLSQEMQVELTDLWKTALADLAR